MRSVKTLKTAYVALQLFYMAEVCTVSGFAVFFLSSRGLSNTAAGAVVALARLLSILAVKSISQKLDTDKTLLKKLFPLAAALLLLLHAALAFTASSALTTFAVFAAASLLSALCASLSVILYTDLVFGGVEIEYGFSRGLGSFSYTVVSYFAGRLAAAYSPELIPIIGIVAASGFLCAVAFICADMRPEQTGPASPDRADGKLLQYIRGRKGLGLFFAGILLIYMAYISGNSYAINMIRSIGGSAGELGIYNALGALFEIPFMMIFSKASIKNSKLLLRISLLLMTCKVLVLALSQNLVWIYAAAFLQGASFGLYTPSIVNFIKNSTSYAHSAKGQSVASIASSLGGVCGMLISGRLLDILQVRPVLRIMFSVSVAGAAVVWLATAKISAAA